MKIELQNISKRINKTHVLKNITLDFIGGNIYGIVGKNGSGKTMLLRAISGMIVPSEGKIFIDSQELHKDISFPTSMGILIEKPEFISYLSGFTNLKLLSEIKNIVTEPEIQNLMKFFDLDPKSKKSVRKYSLGMKQKLGIIQAIMENPELLILDEAFNALDETAVVKLRNYLNQCKEENKIIIITSHNNEDIEVLCDVIYTIDQGEILSV